MRRPWVEPSGFHRDQYTGEQVGRTYRTTSGRIVHPKRKMVYQYPWTVDKSNLSNALEAFREVCEDALDIEEEIRAQASRDAAENKVELAVFSLAHAANQFGLDKIPKDSIQFFYTVRKLADSRNMDLFGWLEVLKYAIEGAIGYKLGGHILQSYEKLLDNCGAFFLITGAIQVSDASPGFFDREPLLLPRN